MRLDKRLKVIIKLCFYYKFKELRKINNIETKFSEKDQQILDMFNSIINVVHDPYLWRELSRFDLMLRDRFNLNKEVNDD
jgi:hypothetical protein